MIAQIPQEPRDSARLMLLNRTTGELEHTYFSHLGNYLHAPDLVVLNETRVIPARIYAHKIPSGGRIELLLLKRRDTLVWEVLVGGKGISIGKHLKVGQSLEAEIVEVMDGAQRLVRFNYPIEPLLDRIGQIPLPPYIHTELNNPERYQTVYSLSPGSTAAPTAGLHFTPRLIEELVAQGIRFTKILLHIGLDTFAPVTEDDPEKHRIHTEWCQVNEQTVADIRQARRDGGRIVAVGTTCVRAIESAAQLASTDELVSPFIGPTDLFILPGYQFRTVQAMITNFHLPRSTLIMLVSAFAGRERIMAAYEEAKLRGYRFYSFGDAILIQ